MKVHKPDKPDKYGIKYDILMRLRHLLHILQWCLYWALWYFVYAVSTYH